MHPYPHHYTVSGSAVAGGAVTISAAELAPLETAPPREFDGPGGTWSPETLLCAALADCFLLTFRILARIGRFEWQRLECRVEGQLERIERVPHFTRFAIHAALTVGAGADQAKGRLLLEQSERGCLISNSLRGERTLEAQILVAGA
jgi:organic hydroperoxide reductase OsmC/OhrA